MPFPASSPAVLRLSGGRRGVGPRNRRADVYRLGRGLPRSRVCSLSLSGGGASVCLPAVVLSAELGLPGAEVAAAAAPTLQRPIKVLVLFLGVVAAVCGISNQEGARLDLLCFLSGVSVGELHVSFLLCFPLGSFFFRVGVHAGCGFVFRGGRRGLSWWLLADCWGPSAGLGSDLAELCSGTRRRWRSWVERMESLIADVPL
ncbi:unnamed protein product [Urochloa humidicola]